MGEIHNYVERRETPICDFCCRKDAVWTFPSTKRMDMTVPYKGRMVELRDSPAWGSCNDCSPIVESGDCVQLAEYIATILPSDGFPHAMHVAALTMMYAEVVPYLQPKIPAVKTEGGHVTHAQGDKEFIEDVKKWREDLERHRRGEGDA